LGWQRHLSPLADLHLACLCHELPHNAKL
jgi:hypothetical protein